MKSFKLLLILFLFVFFKAISQEILTKDQAVNLALDHNYGIKIANNKATIAKNNARIFNSKYLPTLTANAGLNYSSTDVDNQLQNGSIVSTDNAAYNNYNASVALRYTLFDGFGRIYNYKKLKETHQISELDARLIIENTFLNVFSKYFEVARLTQNENSVKQSLAISKQRFKRVSYSFEYGQNTKLEVLNAEVDVNNDSISYLNIKRQLANAKRDLNLIVGNEITTSLKVETDVLFLENLAITKLLQESLTNNVTILKAESNIELGNYDLKINNAGWFPTLNLNSSYGLTNFNNDATFLYSEQNSKNLSAGLSLSWNIFDSGTTKTKVQNAKISLENLAIQKEELVQELKRNVLNAWEVYRNNLFILKAEETNLATNTRNFERTEELFKLGQITSIQFRQAQVNLLNAETNLNRAKYEAKMAEIILLQLSGNLLNTPF
ncbi:MAG: TolC family protein [Flavobacteriaceae bacterium]|nr:TolC family protein [Flavobacteriaceae bacterium]